jgi:hypothetical protein
LHICFLIVNIRLILSFQDWSQAQARGDFGPFEELCNLGNIIEFDTRHHMVRLGFLEKYYINYGDHEREIDTKK